MSRFSQAEILQEFIEAAERHVPSNELAFAHQAYLRFLEIRREAFHAWFAKPDNKDKRRKWVRDANRRYRARRKARGLPCSPCREKKRA